MFARYIGESGAGLTNGEIYYMSVAEEVKHYNYNSKPAMQRFLVISVGDYWTTDYESYGEAMMDWEF